MLPVSGAVSCSEDACKRCRPIYGRTCFLQKFQIGRSNGREFLAVDETFAAHFMTSHASPKGSGFQYRVPARLLLGRDSIPTAGDFHVESKADPSQFWPAIVMMVTK